jgi:hypothetical protein
MCVAEPAKFFSSKAALSDAGDKLIWNPGMGISEKRWSADYLGNQSMNGAFFLASWFLIKF